MGGSYSLKIGAFVVYLASLLAFLVLAAGPLYAQNEQGLGAKTQPTLIEERIDPGSVVQGTLRITNVSGSQQTYAVSARDVEDVSAEGQAVFKKVSDDSGLELSSWVTLDRNTITVGPNQTESIGYVISVPENAPPGGHFGGIFFARKADETTELGVSIGFEVGTLMNIQVNGDVVESIEIREFSSDKTIYSGPDAKFTTTLFNTGTVLQRPRGALQIVDMFGNQVDTLTVNENAAGALPGKERVFTVDWEEAEEGLYIGKYTAVLSVAYGQEQSATASRELTFWIIPFKTVGTALGILIAVLFFFYLWTRMYVRKQLRRAGYSTKAAPRGQKTYGQRLMSVMVVLLTLSILALMALFLFFG